MGIISRCFCDPFKLTYVSAIVTSVEAVVFGVLNIVLICMYTCTIQPPSEVALGFDRFWAYYFFDKENCENKGMNSPPDWTNYNFTLTPEERSLTTPYDNFIYQCIYLALHGGWILTGIILIYGNARKRWGYYLPWLLVTTTILVMDITISAFCIQDLVAIDADRYVSAMFFILVLYFRVFFIWFINMSQYASACNAFCKSRHKRAKQEHTRQKMAKAHAQEIARAEAATEARVRAQIAEQQAAQEQQRAAQEQQPRRKIPPPVPKKPAAPPELRPFSYLNPAYRPNDPTDVEGMRANPTVAPDIPPKPVKVQQLAGPYFPDDGYSRERHPEGLQRRYDSMRNYRTQDRHPALRRFSSTRGHPSYPQATPYVPAPDYDMTMRPRPSSNQSEYDVQLDCLLHCGGNSNPASLSVTHNASIGQGQPYLNTLYRKVASQAYQTPSESFPHNLIPVSPSRPSPILYTQTANRTHLQIYTSDTDEDSLQGEQEERLVFGGVFVPLHSRKLTLRISNSFLKAKESDEELPERFWDAQWRSMREERANSAQTNFSAGMNRHQSHFSHERDKDSTIAIVKDNERFWNAQWRSMREGRANSSRRQLPERTSSSLSYVSHKRDTDSTDAVREDKDRVRKNMTPGKDLKPVNVNISSGNANKNKATDTLNSSRIINEASFKTATETSNRRTLAVGGIRKHGRRKLSETYADVVLQELHGRASPYPPRPWSVSSEDMLPSNPAFPIRHKAS